MTTNINTNLLIVNTQRNSNTVLQGSTLISTGGTLNEVLDTQALRTVKGYLSFPVAGTTQSGSPLIVLNQYDQSPLCFNPGDIIIAFTIANGSTCYPGTSFPAPFSAGTVSFYSHDGFTYPPQLVNGVWTVSSEFTALSNNQITSTITLADLGSGVPSASNPPVALNETSSLTNLGFGLGTLGDGSYQNYVYMVGNAISIPPVAQGSNSAVNITMLVMNASLAQ